MIFLLLLLCGLIGLGGTLLLEKLATGLNLVKAPNERSSHTVPTPRGGGVAIAVVACLVALALAAGGESPMWWVAGLVGLTACLGLADDIVDLSPAIRFPIQIMSFTVLVWAMPALPAVALPMGVQLGGLLLAIVVIVAGVWWLNLFNFIDGIDGLAATQAILVLVGAAVIGWGRDFDAAGAGALWLTLATAAATGGFLVRNWPPAHIFMGDAGSNALAMVVFAIAVLTIGSGVMSYQVWLILPAAAVADSTITLLRRLARGERPWHAHRRHGYQQLSRRWGHRRTTLVYGLLTLCWAVPIAMLADHSESLAWGLVILAYAPLVAFVLWSDGGGASESVPSGPRLL